MSYQKILLASDLSEETFQLIDRAKEIGGKSAQIHIAHVIQSLGAHQGTEIMLDLSSVQEQVHQQSLKSLNALAEKANIAPDMRHLLVGRPDLSIAQCIKEIDADLIIAGRHKRAGLMLLFGSTSSNLLRETHVDALFVQIKPEQNEED